MKYKLLIIEDDPAWISDFHDVCDRRQLLKCSWATNTADAWKAIEASPVHFISIDQHIPLVVGESITAAHGMDLLSQVVEQRPFIRATIYTANGQIEFANRAGRLGDTEYFEKRLQDTQKNGIDISPYFRLIETMLAGGDRAEGQKPEAGYIRWALGRGQLHLPPSLALNCDKVLKGFEGEYSGSTVLDGMSKLLERTVELAWAQAAALLAAQHPGSQVPVFHAVPENSLNGFQKSLAEIFTELDEDLGQWFGYVTARDRGGRSRPGQTFLDAANTLRLERNPHVHEKQEFSKADFTHLEPAWLDLIDGLAFWADFKLMNNVGIHPDDRDKLRFHAIAGRRPWRASEVRSLAKPPTEEMRRLGVHMLYRPSRGAERLVNLFPFISMVERAGLCPEPALLLPGSGGRGVLRRSLETGEEIKGAQATDRERAAIGRLFGNSWRP